MGYFLSFALLYVGYSLLDWGHYVLKHEKVPLWYLMTGYGDSGDLPPIIKGGTTPLRNVGTQAVVSMRTPTKINK